MFTTRVRRCRFSLYQDHVIAHPVLVVLVFLIADHHHLWASHIVGHVQTSSFDAVLCTVNVQHLQSPEKVCPPLLPLLHSLRPSASSTFCGRMGGEVDDRTWGAGAATWRRRAHRVWMRRCWAVVDARWQVVTDDEGLSPGPYKYLRSFSSVEDAGYDWIKEGCEGQTHRLQSSCGK
uniref:Uncharacterized protein n=1 Tax=Oryza glumipatula TaxID=40148 RepID=A0A0E0A807_9ORYZ